MCSGPTCGGVRNVQACSRGRPPIRVGGYTDPIHFLARSVTVPCSRGRPPQQKPLPAGPARRPRILARLTADERRSHTPSRVAAATGPGRSRQHLGHPTGHAPHGGPPPTPDRKRTRRRTGPARPNRPGRPASRPRAAGAAAYSHLHYNLANLSRGYRAARLPRSQSTMTDRPGAAATSSRPGPRHRRAGSLVWPPPNLTPLAAQTL